MVNSTGSCFPPATSTRCTFFYDVNDLADCWLIWLSVWLWKKECITLFKKRKETCSLLPREACFWLIWLFGSLMFIIPHTACRFCMKTIENEWLLTKEQSSILLQIWWLVILDCGPSAKTYLRGAPSAAWISLLYICQVYPSPMSWCETIF